MTGRQIRARFDMGRAYEALAYDYSEYELPQRRPMLLHKLEACIEPVPVTTAPVDRVAEQLHLVTAGWLILAGLPALILAPQLWWIELVSAGVGGYALYRHFRTPHHRKEHP